MVDATGNHARFQKHLSDSQEAVWLVAGWLHGRGHSVTVNAAGVADTAAEWQKFVDSGDLNISLRVEVKGLSAEFTCRDDWPFKDKFIVCEKRSFDRAVPKPHGYFYLNKDRTHAAIVMSSSARSWTVEERTDKRYQGVSQEFYFCPMDEVKFVRLH